MMSTSLLLLAAAFALIALAERIRPARPAQLQRWPLNLALGLGNALLTRLAAAAGPLGAALYAQSHGLGLFHSLSLPLPLVAMLVVLLMDLAIYGQHRAMHRFTPLWHFHKLHHGDADFDVTTGVRFHPGEALLSMLYKAAIVLLLGAPPETVVIFEVWLALGSFIEHGNIRLPERLDAALRRIWVTPAMHLVHHSAEGEDHNHNFGFALSIWDHLFGSYQSRATGPRIGLPTS
jgi:sterol desaturase/sphingolipid hydroxylase (fatty acid hydroxylase superfamily)